MNYHSKKMGDINKIIRELWRNTYRGNGEILPAFKDLQITNEFFCLSV